MKSTVVGYGFPLLLFDLLLDHLAGDITRVYDQIPTSPEMSAPELLFQVRKLRQRHTRAYSFQPLYNLADIPRRTLPHKHVDMLARHLAFDKFNFALQSTLPRYAPHSNCNRPGEHPFPVLRNPNQVNVQVRLCMSPKFIKSHSDSVYTFLLLKARGFHHPRQGH